MQDSAYRSLVRRLERYRNAALKMSFLSRLAWSALLTMVLAAALGLLEAILWLPPVARLRLAVFTGVGLGICWSLLLLPPVLRRMRKPGSWARVAYEVGARIDGLGDRLGNAVWVYENTAKQPGVSRALAELGLRQAEESTREGDFATVVDRSAWLVARRWLAGGVVGFSLIVALAPRYMWDAWSRLAHPHTVYFHEPTLQLQVKPGDTEVLRGSALDVICTVSGGNPDRVTLVVTPEGDRNQEQLAAKKDSAGIYSWRLEKVERSFDYWVEAGGFRSESYHVTAVEPPILRELQVRLIYPAYTGLKPTLLEPNVGDVSALVGTRVVVHGKANKPLRWAAIAFDRGDTLELNVDSTQIRGEFVVQEDGEYWFQLTDTKGYRSRKPIHYRIAAIRDAVPVVSIPVPGKEVQLDESMVLPLVVMAEDDFGFRRLELRYRVLAGTEWVGAVDTSWKRLALPIPGGEQDRLTVEYDWSLAELDLMPEDEVEYYAVAYDNDTVTGPKRGRSATYRVRYPSVYELYEEVRKEQEAAFENLTDVRQRARDLRQRVREIAREMLRDTEMDWERRQQLSEMASEQQKVLDQLKSVEQKLDSAIQAMEKNQLVALETLEKYRQIQELVRQIDNPQFRQALQRLQQAMERLDPERVQQALKNLQTSQEDLLESLDRTIELLKRLKLMQELEELRTKVENLLQRQGTVNRALAESKEDARKLVRQEQTLARDAGDLEQQLRELAQAMQEVLQKTPAGLDSAQAVLDSASAAQQMQQASQFLQEGQRQQALQAGNRAMNTLLRLAQNLSSAQSELSGRQAMETAQGLQRAAWQALELSKAQEELWRRLQGARRGSESLAELAERQAELREALNRITEQLMDLSRRSFAITPEVAQALGQAAEQMERSISQLESRNPGSAQKAAFQAMNSLNRLSLGVQSALQQAMGSSGQGSLEQWLQQLMGLSERQQWLNQQTMQFGLGQRWTPEQQAALEQLAARQQALRRMLEQLLRQAAGQAGAAGRLDRVADEMKDVENDLRQGRIRQETLDKQRRILSRLLDAQRSIRRRGYSRKRKAETAKKQLASHPGALPSDLGESVNSWRRDLLRALKEGYTRDFRRIIEAYFQAMAKEETAQP